MPIQIYYLDDEPDILELFADSFSSADVRIRTFSDPTVAVEWIRKEPPDLLFLDYRLPNTTGDQIALSLDPAIPKVLVTGEIGLLPRAEYVAVFRKPFQLKKIEELIHSFLSKLSPR